MIDFIFEKKLYNSGPFDAEHLLWYQNSILVHERSMITLFVYGNPYTHVSCVHHFTWIRMVLLNLCVPK